MKSRVTLAALLAVATTSAVASAQQAWIRDRRYGEGIGIRTGDLELHPGVAAEFGYDSNFFQRSGTDTGSIELQRLENPIVEAWRLRITPHLTLSTLSSQRREAEGLGGEQPAIEFRAGLYASYNEFFRADSSDPEGIDEFRDLAAGANFFANILPQRPVGFDVYGDYVRAIDASNSPEEDSGFDRNSFRAGAGINWRPGGGLFSWRAGYQANFHLFEENAFENLNNWRHFIQSQTRWRFLPRTALIGDAEYGIVRFSEDNTSQNDGETVRARGGINGLVTNHFGVTGIIGWGASFFDDSPGGHRAQNYDGLIGQAEVKWFIQPAPSLEATSAAVGLSTIALGATRDFSASYLGSFYVRNRAYLNASAFIAGVLVIGAEGGLSLIEIPRTFDNGGAELEPSFDQKRIDAQLFAEYRFTNTFGLNTTLRYDRNFGEVVTVRNPSATAPIAEDDLDFERFQAYLGARLFW